MNCQVFIRSFLYAIRFFIFNEQDIQGIIFIDFFLFDSYINSVEE